MTLIASRNDALHGDEPSRFPSLHEASPESIAERDAREAEYKRSLFHDEATLRKVGTELLDNGVLQKLAVIALTDSSYAGIQLEMVSALIIERHAHELACTDGGKLKAIGLSRSIGHHESLMDVQKLKHIRAEINDADDLEDVLIDILESGVLDSIITISSVDACYAGMLLKTALLFHDFSEFSGWGNIDPLKESVNSEIRNLAA